MRMRKQKVEKNKMKNQKEENEDYENENEDENENGDKYEMKNEDDETMSQDEKNKIIKNLNDNLHKIIDKSKLFEEQIEPLKKLEGLEGYWSYKDYDDKKLNLNTLKYKLQTCQMKFEQIFSHTLIKLADKLVNTTNKEENQIIVKNIEKK